uniref:Intraflagellar transport 20 n=1 Tax=Leptobrachium leishanense TaxID=445787 RepID=A0A8C5LVH6_9ANUR
MAAGPTLLLWTRSASPEVAWINNQLLSPWQHSGWSWRHIGRPEQADDPVSVCGSRFSVLSCLYRVWSGFAQLQRAEMARDSLSEAGLHFDELNKLRILDPEVSQQTTELKEECRDFVDKIDQFQKIVGGLIDLVDQLAKETENEKMKAIGARNLLRSIAKQREAQQQQLYALIAEKKMQLERYRIEYDALCKVEAEQNEFIDKFILQK